MALKMEDVKVGDTLVVADDAFTCMREGQEKEVKGLRKGEFFHDLYVECDEGMHFLEGQVDESEEVVGFTKKQ